MATCHTTGCNNHAEPNPADTENGPNARDLDPVYCDDCWDAEYTDHQLTVDALRALGFDTHFIYHTPGAFPPANLYS